MKPDLPIQHVQRLESYITQCTVQLKLEGEFSERKTINVKVSQRRVLVPVLLYTGDIPVTKKHQTSYICR